MKNFVFLFIFILAAAFTRAQNVDSAYIKKISDFILTEGKSYDDLRHLTKKIGGRLAGSKGMVLSENWSEAVFKSLDPDTVYRQQCMVPHWVRGGQDQATAYLSGKKATTKKHTRGTTTAKWIALKSETKPISAVNTAPPIIAIITSDEPALVCEPRPLTLSAKIVGNISDIKKLVDARAIRPPKPGAKIAKVHRPTLIKP